MITKGSIATDLDGINHNLDVFNQTCQEDAAKFNETTITVFTIGSNLFKNITNDHYRIICKIGYGGFSVVWLVIDKKSKVFKAVKVFKYGYGITDLEIKTLQQTLIQPNILRYYDSIIIQTGAHLGCVAIYEPLGKDLNMLMKEATNHRGLSTCVIKKVAKHVLLALKTIHDLKIVHSDIKLHNIAPYVSQLSLRRELEKMVKSEKFMKSLSSLRMVCHKNLKFDENKVRKMLKKELDEVSKLDIKESTELVLKLIDFGNALEEGTLSTTGTYGYRPPEYFFGAPLLPSHDIWSFGVTIVVLLTNKPFIESGTAKKIDEINKAKNIDEIKKAKKMDEIIGLKEMLGEFSRNHFKNFRDYHILRDEFTTNKYKPKEVKKRTKKILKRKFNGLQMLKKDRKDLIDFLLKMLNTVPSQRKSAAELLSHRWLNDVKNGAKLGLPNMAKNDDYYHKLDDDHELPQILSDASKTQEQKVTSVNETGTPVQSVDKSPSSNGKGTCGIPLDEELSIEELMKLKIDVTTLPSTDPKHCKNIGEATGKRKEAAKSNRKLPKDSFIDKKDNILYLFYNNWHIRWREDRTYFQCPKDKCKQRFTVNSNPKFQAKIGFVSKVQHNKKCLLRNTSAPKKYVVETELRRESLLMQGFKPKQKEDKNYEGDNEGDSDETEDETDSEESEEGIVITTSGFGSCESYAEADASLAPYAEYVTADINGRINDFNWSDISSDTLEVSSLEESD